MNETAVRGVPKLWDWRRSGWIVFGLALLVRLWVGIDAQDAPFWTSPLVDEVSYLQMSEREMRGIEPDHGAYYMTPGYAWFLAALNGVGAQLPQIKLFQLGLGALICVLLFLLGGLVFDPRVGWVAALGWMFFPAAILHELLALKPTIAVAATLGAVLAVVRASRSSRWWPVAGGLAGVASLLRGELSLVFAVIFVAVWLSTRGDGGRLERAARDWRGPVLALVCLVGVVAVPTGLNFSRGGGAVVIAYSGGVNFYIGNHQGADGSYMPLRPDRSDSLVEERDAVSIAQAESGRPLRASEVSRFWWRQGLEWWTEHPGGAIALTAKKAVLLLGSWEGNDVLSTRLAGRWVMVLRNPVSRSGVFLALALVGLGLSWRRRDLWTLRLWLALSWWSLVPFFVFERFRLPMVAVALIFAGHALVWSWDRLRERRWSYALAPLLGATLLGAALAVPSVARNESVLHVNVGAMLVQQERYEEALHEFLIVRRTLPDAKRVEINIATALHGLGRDGEALRSLRVVMGFLQGEIERTGRRPVEELVYVHVLTGDILRAQGDTEGARSQYQAAWTLQPGHPELKKKLSKVGISLESP